MRLIIMGTGPFAVPMFQAILRDGHDVPIVVTRPARPVRGRKQPPSNPMREVAESVGIEVWAPESINTPDAIAQLQSYAADLMVVCDYGQILNREALATTRFGGINLHGSLLPKYRGAAPVQWAVINGELTTGITVIHMTPKLDGGPSLIQMETPIEANDNAETLETRLATLGAPAVLQAIRLLDKWDEQTAIGEIQDPAGITKAPRLTKNHGLIDWKKSAKEILNNHHGVQPWPGSFTVWDRGKQPMRLIISQLSISESIEREGLSEPEGHSAGEVIIAENDTLVVACGSGSIRLLEVQPAGKRVMTAGEFLRGYQLKSGIRFQ